LTKYDYGQKIKKDGVDSYVARMVSINTYTVLIKNHERKKVQGELWRDKLGREEGEIFCRKRLKCIAGKDI